jgi:hypothetical protein
MPETNEAPVIKKKTEKTTRLIISVSMDVILEASTIPHLEKLIFDIRGALYCIEAIPLVVDSAK